MKINLICFVIFFYSLLLSLSVVQQWNFENSSKDLLTSGEQSIKVLEETKDGLYAKLYKYIAKENGVVVYKKYLTVYYNGNFVYDGEVDFDNIQNYCRFENDNTVFHIIFYQH